MGVGRSILWGIFAALGFWLATNDEVVADMSTSTQNNVRIGGLVLMALMVPGLVRSVARAIAGGIDLFGRHDVEGVVLRKRHFEEGHQLPPIVRWIWQSQKYNRHNRHQRHYRRFEVWVVIDDGTDSTVTALRVDESTYRRMG